MYHVNAQGADERMINVHYYYYYNVDLLYIFCIVLMLSIIIIIKLIVHSPVGKLV